MGYQILKIQLLFTKFSPNKTEQTLTGLAVRSPAFQSYPDGPCKPPALPASACPGTHGGAWTKCFSLQYPLFLPVRHFNPISRQTLMTNLILDVSTACIMFPTDATAILFWEGRRFGIQGNTLKCHSQVYYYHQSGGVGLMVECRP